MFNFIKRFILNMDFVKEEIDRCVKEESKKYSKISDKLIISYDGKLRPVNNINDINNSIIMDVDSSSKDKCKSFSILDKKK